MKDKSREVAFLLGLPFNVMTMDETIEDAVSIVQSRHPSYFITANVDFVAQARNDAKLREILFHADRAVCDGMPLVWISRFFKPSLPERVAGSDMVFRLFEQAGRLGWRVFFLGSDPETLASTTAILNEQYPKMEIVGSFSPPFGPVDRWPNDAICQTIQTAKPDLLLVAVGCPKQEYWISQHYEILGVPLSIGIGASLDFVAGSQIRAPKILQKIGMEWSWRLLTNPKRLAKRYAKDFYYLIVLSYLQWKLTRSASDHAVESDQPYTEAVNDFAMTTIEWKGNVDFASLESLEMPEHYELPVLLDVSDVPFMDSSGIGRLAKVARLARQAEVPFALLNPRPSVRNLIEAMRLESQFPMFSSREETIAFFQGRAVDSSANTGGASR